MQVQAARTVIEGILRCDEFSFATAVCFWAIFVAGQPSFVGSGREMGFDLVGGGDGHVFEVYRRFREGAAEETTWRASNSDESRRYGQIIGK